MQHADRIFHRNTFIYDFNHRDTLLGGLWIMEGTTNANLYSMVEIICVLPIPSSYGAIMKGWLKGMRNPFNRGITSSPVMVGLFSAFLVGHYSLETGSVTLTEDATLFRCLSLQSGPRTTSFGDAVRERDRGCVISGKAALPGKWKAYEVAHIVPLAYEGLWNRSNYSRWITAPPANESDGYIHSVQNGMLLCIDINTLFDCYDVSINPDV